MIRRETDCLRIEGEVTHEQVGRLHEEGRRLIEAGATRVDMSGVTSADSGALALLLGWMRECRRTGRRLTVVNLAPGLDSLAKLYGVDEFLQSKP